MKHISFLCLFCFYSVIHAQVVPNSMVFMNTKITFTPNGKAEVQKFVNTLVQYKKSVNYTVQLCLMHFPILERVLAQEQVPDDFKYVCLQESKFNPNAVSPSQAVGYWQMKLSTAKAVGLIVDEKVDERKHLILSTQAACRYVKMGYDIFHNWIGGLLAYNQGGGGAKKLFPSKFYNKNEFVVDSQTPTYIIHAIAYKVAFSEKIKNTTPEKTFQLSKPKENNSWYEFAKQHKVDVDELKKYNAFVKEGHFLKNYVYLIPQKAQTSKIDETLITNHLPQNNNPSILDNPDLVVIRDEKTAQEVRKQKYVFKVNKIKSKQEINIGDTVLVTRPKTQKPEYHIVKSGDTLSEIAEKYRVSVSELKKHNPGLTNEIKIGQRIRIP
ncbi:MAG: transglycosylase SLT domain-containing protein [Bacteroidia bacterium]|nr:transglycosylase SLT domain-containing protein [Bacteroidia bacterium]MDW8345440.1 transglycosylase SLT domain-containing protein [Bacteroidia bacterium]